MILRLIAIFVSAFALVGLGMVVVVWRGCNEEAE